MELPFANLQIKHWNPGASAPLILPVHVVCNTSDEQIHDNIRINSCRPGEWFFVRPAHERIAVICGSGPSLKDDLALVRERVAAGADLFALNGSAAWLNAQGLMPDFQVILDAQPQTADLVGPARAHYFASQCHPDTFAKAPDAVLWHLQIEGIDDLLPADHVERDHTLIGAASSVGTTATVLAFAMGYRELHCYGFDSSNKGEESHAFRQPMNDGEPMAYVTFNGKTYLSSLTMKLQAERFPETARLLEREGCKVHVHGYGLLPDIWNAPAEVLSEREKYQRLWTMPSYRQMAPGEYVVGTFLDVARPPKGASVLDFGCGTGRAALELKLAGMAVTLVDFAANCRDQGAAHLPFLEWDLTEPMPLRSEYGYCTDVLEHIPPADVRKVVANLIEATPRLFISVDTKPDVCGAMINQTLHLTLMEHAEWLALLGEFGRIEWNEERGDASLFYLVRSDVY